jgi:hypothetical protein
VALLKQCVGTLIALTYILTRKPEGLPKLSRCRLLCRIATGQTERRESARQLHITREGDSYLRIVLVQGAQDIREPFGNDSDLRRWELKPAERPAIALNPQPRSSFRPWGSQDADATIFSGLEILFNLQGYRNRGTLPAASGRY